MPKPHFPILILVVLFNFPVNLFHLDFATTVVPGWHTTIYSISFLDTIFVSTTLIMISLLYWKVFGKYGKVSILIFTILFLCSLPALIFLKFSIFIFYSIIPDLDEGEFNDKTHLLLNIQSVFNVMFSIAQILLTIYLILKWKVEARIDE